MKAKFHRFIPLTISSLLLASCSFSFGEFSSFSSKAASSSNGRSSSSASSQSEASSTISEDDGTLKKTKMRYTYHDVTTNSIYDIDSSPNSGEVHPLIIPIWFSDSTDYVPSSMRDRLRNDIRLSYFGSEQETGWHSVKTFYENQSEGKLKLSGVTSDWYDCNKPSTYFYGTTKKGIGYIVDEDLDTKMGALTTSAVEWYFAQPGAKSRSYFDSDRNGYLDVVMFIYAAPDYAALDDETASNMWAYCYWAQDPDVKNSANPGLNTYFWSSYDFIYDAKKTNELYGNSYASGSNEHCVIDSHTFIHEMGHVFGLDDYYDYSEEHYCPAGGFSMEDYNIGAHDAFSVLSLGWSDPYIPKTSCEIELSPFQNGHETILLTPEWNSYDSPFDEYLLLEFYTPTGLNEFDCEYPYLSMGSGPKASGIRLWHVDARLAYVNEINGNQEPVYKSDQLTSNPEERSGYGVVQAFTNTYGSSSPYISVLGSAYSNYNVLQLIRNSATADFDMTEFISADDLFGNGSSFNQEKYRKQFVKGNKLNNGSALGWSFSVSISGEGEEAKATVTLTKAS